MMMRTPFFSLPAAGLYAAALLAFAGAALGQTPRPAAEVPPPVEMPATPAEVHEKAPVKVPKARPKKMVLKKTGQVVYKCGDSFTDQPVCPDQTRAIRLKPSAEDQARCEQFRRTDYDPWYCRK
jgi:hypothetical protein